MFFRTKDMLKSRKVVLFLISMILVATLAYFNKDYAGIVTLYGLYCTGNVAQKFKTNT